MTATRRRSVARLAAGLDVGSTGVRVALVESDDEGRRRVRALEREALGSGVLERGVVREPEALTRAIRAALARAEFFMRGRRAQTLVVASAADDLRSHRHVTRVLRSGDAAVSDAELHRAGEQARRDGAREAVRVVGDEPGLRRLGLVPLQAVAARVALDGRPLVAIGRQRGQVLEVELVVPVLPLAQSTGLEAAVAPLRRDTRFVAAPLALGSLVAESGVEDAVIVDIGAQLTGVCVVRDGAPTGARAFSLGTAAFADARRVADARIWARCAILAASDLAAGSALPTRVLVAGGGAARLELHAALAEAVGRLQPTLSAHAESLGAALLTRLESDVDLRATDLVAVAAGAA